MKALSSVDTEEAAYAWEPGGYGSLCPLPLSLAVQSPVPQLSGLLAVLQTGPKPSLRSMSNPNASLSLRLVLPFPQGPLLLL